MMCSSSYQPSHSWMGGACLEQGFDVDSYFILCAGGGLGKGVLVSCDQHAATRSLLNYGVEQRITPSGDEPMLCV